jgi:hypothetical protein
MPCKPLLDKHGRTVGFACSRRETIPCHVCGKPMTTLCDATDINGKSCDKPMCDAHKHTVWSDTDVCDEHNSPPYIQTAIQNRQERAVKEMRERTYGRKLIGIYESEAADDNDD